MAANSSNTPRILTRGETTQFKVSFFLDEAETTALVPVTPDYPKYTIYDPNGTPVQSGTGNLTTPGRYTAQFLVPKDAQLSYFQQKPQTYNDENQGLDLTANEGRYRIEWTIVTAENYQLQFVEEFDVRDTAITQSLSRELKYLTLAGDEVRLLYRTTTLPNRTRLRVVIRGNDASPILEDQLDLSGPTPQGNIKYAKDGDSYVLYYDLPEGVTLRNTCYVVLWNIRETAFTPATTEYQVLTSIATNLMPAILSLRMLLDKFQKRIGRIQAYDDGEILEYIARGVQLVNSQYPYTGYSLDTMPDVLNTYVFLAAGWYGLQAQSILNAELGFSFTGQSVTLSVDQQSGLDAAASKMMEMFNGNAGLAATKMSLVRKSQGVGTVATRSYGYRGLSDYVFKMNSVSNGGNNFMELLSKIGLL